MSEDWSDQRPIYRQLMDEIVSWILSGKLNDGDPLPSARKIALEYEINPLTAVKAYQELTSENILQKERGTGLFVRPGAQSLLLSSKKQQFLDKEWPEIVQRIELMEIDVEELLSTLKKTS